MVALTNRLKTVGSEADDTTQCLVREAIRQSAHGGLSWVECELKEGMAILHGKVSSFYLKQMAQELAKKVDGVQLVVNRVEVAYR